MGDLDLRLLEGLDAISSAGSFTAAAARLHVSQPALSQSMRRLERIVGVQLIDRHAHGATLTPAGESLVADATVVFAQLNAAVARAVRAGDGRHAPDLVIGFGTTTPASLIDLVLRLDEREIGARILLEHVPWGQESARLVAGDVDVVVMPRVAEGDLPVVAVDVGTYPRVAVFREGHPLAERSSVRIGELDREPIIDAGSDRDYWLVLPRPSGATPSIVPPAARSVDEMFAFVRAGRGMAITSASSMESAVSEGIRFVPIEDVDHVVLAVARLQGDVRGRLLRLQSAIGRTNLPGL